MTSVDNDNGANGIRGLMRGLATVPTVTRNL